MPEIMNPDLADSSFLQSFRKYSSTPVVFVNQTTVTVCEDVFRQGSQAQGQTLLLAFHEVLVENLSELEAHINPPDLSILWGLNFAPNETPFYLHKPSIEVYVLPL